MLGGGMRIEEVHVGLVKESKWYWREWEVLKVHQSDNQKEVTEIKMHMVMINVKEKS